MSAVGSIRHPSMSRSRSGPGLRAMTMGSHAGFNSARDFGNPEAYPHTSMSRMIQPASSRAHVIRWTVRVPPNASRYAPGLATRMAADAQPRDHSP